MIFKLSIDKEFNDINHNSRTYEHAFYFIDKHQL